MVHARNDFTGYKRLEFGTREGRQVGIGPVWYRTKYKYQPGDPLGLYYSNWYVFASIPNALCFTVHFYIRKITIALSSLSSFETSHFFDSYFISSCLKKKIHYLQGFLIQSVTCHTYLTIAHQLKMNPLLLCLHFLSVSRQEHRHHLIELPIAFQRRSVFNWHKDVLVPTLEPFRKRVQLKINLHLDHVYFHIVKQNRNNQVEHL